MNTFIIILVALALLYSIGIISRNRRAKNKIVNVIEENCTGCQNCIKKCRHKALEITNDENGRYVVLKFPEKCTACQNCIKTCKFKALKLTNRK